MARTPPAPVADVGLLLRRALLRAADALLPPWAVMWERTMSQVTFHVVGTMVDLGVPDALTDRPATAAELAPRLQVDADALHRVLRAAAVAGVVRLDRRGRFHLTRVGKALRTDAPDSLAPWASYLALDSTRAAWADLTESVRTGDPAFPRVHGDSVWKWFAAHPEEERLFAAAMRSITEFDAPDAAAASLWPESGTVCDVAGGAGTLLASILERRPALRGVLVEAPGVLAEADTYLSGRGLRDRVELVEGDMFNEVRAEADVYALKNVLHDWDDAACLRILGTVRGAMRPGARLVLVEQLQGRNDPHPFTTLTDLHMMTQVDGGRERSREELQALLEQAGMRAGEVKRLAASALVEGVAE